MLEYGELLKYCLYVPKALACSENMSFTVGKVGQE